VSERSELLELLVSAEVVSALRDFVASVATEAVREELARQPQRRWLSLAEAA
jgi:hypothetical protein